MYLPGGGARLGSHPYFTHVDGDALDLLEKIFVYEPDKRLTAEKALEHPFFKDFHDKRNKSVEENLATFAADTIVRATLCGLLCMSLPADRAARCTINAEYDLRTTGALHLAQYFGYTNEHYL